MRRRPGEFLASVCVLVVLAWVGDCRAQSAVATSAPTACTADPQLLPRLRWPPLTPVAEKNRGLTTIGEYGLPRFTMRGVSLSFLLSFSFDVRPVNPSMRPHGLESMLVFAMCRWSRRVKHL